MKNLTLLMLALITTVVFAQQPAVTLTPKTITNMPGLQSYAWADYNGYWIMIGGRTDGLHLRQPNQSFAAAGKNTMIYAINTSTWQVTSISNTSLPTAIKEQIESTNMQFVQRNDKLVLIGGYGYAPSAADHITHPQLTVVDLPLLIGAIAAQTNLPAAFSSVTDQRMAVTGAHLTWFNNKFYLVGGHRFDGRYNPMNGPSFTQTYTNAISTFDIDYSGAAPLIQNYATTVDAINLHRRDYNLSSMLYANGDEGLVAWSGVFQTGVDLPFLNNIAISATGYAEIPNLSQNLNQYHTANTVIHNAAANETHAIFFGGISQFWVDASGNLVQNDSVPFVKTISMITRKSDDTFQEYALPATMPGYLGASAEFIPASQATPIGEGIINWDATSTDSVLIGYIVGGISSTAPNIFFSNTGTQSAATTSVFEVWIKPETTNAIIAVNPQPSISIAVNPNPINDHIQLTINGLQKSSNVQIDVLDITGKRVANYGANAAQANSDTLYLGHPGLANGIYFLRVLHQNNYAVQKIVIATQE